MGTVRVVDRLSNGECYGNGKTMETQMANNRAPRAARILTRIFVALCKTTTWWKKTYGFDDDTTLQHWNHYSLSLFQHRFYQSGFWDISLPLSDVNKMQ